MKSIFTTHFFLWWLLCVVAGSVMGKVAVVLDSIWLVPVTVLAMGLATGILHATGWFDQDQ
jgi:hypothetical protein